MGVSPYANGLRLFCYEGEGVTHLKQALEQVLPESQCESPPDMPSITIMTGPEGGFEPYEAKHAVAAGMVSVSLGPRILRCETAPVAALAAVMFFTGNL